MNMYREKHKQGQEMDRERDLRIFSGLGSVTLEVQLLPALCAMRYT